jgi:hypothetical protein
MKATRLTSAFGAAALGGLLVLAACDFEVSNPGPVQDENINLVGAHRGLVNGAIRSVQNSLGGTYVGENIVHGITPSGHTGTGGTTLEEEIAVLTDENNGDNGTFGDSQRGRWVAEEAIRRFTAEGSGVSPNSPLLAEAYLWAGLGHRILGENMCTAVTDGGAAEAKTKYFEWAIAHFTNAERVAQAAGLNDIMMAAVGARASAHLWLGNATAARTDAARVPANFRFTTKYTGRGGEDYYTYGTVMSLAFQSASFWGTPMHTHFLTTGDSRAAWGYDNGSLEIPAGRQFAVRAQTHPARQSWVGLVPLFYPLAKGYAPRNAARELRIYEPILDQQRLLQVNLVTGREMQLIIAETYLMQGNFQQAMTHINNVRTATPIYRANLATAMNLTLHPQEQADKVRSRMPDYFTGTPGDFSAGGNMPALTATSLEAAWAALKFERYLETNLEARRFGDRWRWRRNNTPGALHPLELLPAEIASRFNIPADPLNLCFPLSRGENTANQNIEETFKDWTDRP